MKNVIKLLTYTFFDKKVPCVKFNTDTNDLRPYYEVEYCVYVEDLVDGLALNREEFYSTLGKRFVELFELGVKLKPTEDQIKEVLVKTDSNAIYRDLMAGILVLMEDGLEFLDETKKKEVLGLVKERFNSNIDNWSIE